MTNPTIRVPATTADTCGRKSPRTNLPCNRAEGHTGRHHFAWKHIDGRVREVWDATCQICGQRTDGAVCRDCGGD